MVSYGGFRECRHLTHSDPWDIAEIVHQAPLVSYKVELEYMVVDLVCVLIESSKGIYLVVSAEGNGCVHQTSRSLAQSSSDLWFVAIHTETTLDR